LLKLDFNPFLPTKHYKYGQIWWVLFATSELITYSLVVAQPIRTQH